MFGWQLKIKIFFISCLLFSCEFYRVPKNDEYQDIKLVGHGGLGFINWLYPTNIYPENSFTALTKAIEKYGADGIETDVYLSSDNVLILYHDLQLSSKTNIQGCLIDKSANEVIGLPYQVGLPFDWFQNERIISFDSLMHYFALKNRFPYIHIDAKIYNDCKKEVSTTYLIRYQKALQDLIKKHHWPIQKLALNTTYLPFAEMLQDSIPQLSVYFEIGDFHKQFSLIHNSGLTGLSIKEKIASQGIVDSIKNANLKVVVYGGKIYSGISKTAHLKPDEMQVDNLSVANDVLRRN